MTDIVVGTHVGFEVLGRNKMLWTWDKAVGMVVQQEGTYQEKKQKTCHSFLLFVASKG